MAARRPPTGAPPPGAGGSGGRSNEYFVPRDGIDREVITADICRYLGNDALVRPGHYENPQTGQVVQGYYITAYRNLTSAMIEDLKADSARWEAERRQQAARNAPAGYRDSATHNARQHFGPTGDAAGYPDGRDYDGPRYPGSSAPGYSGNSQSGYGQNQASSPYPPGGAGYGSASYGSGGAAAYPPATDSRERYSGQPGYDQPYTQVAANSVPRQDPYAQRGGMPSSGPPAPQPNYAPAPGAYGNSAPGYYPPSNQPGFGGPPQPVQASQDPYGRGANPNPAYPTGPSQYDSKPRPSASASTQMASSGSSHPSRRDRESSERHHGDRHRPSRR